MTEQPTDPKQELIAQLFAANRGQKATPETMGAYLLALRKMPLDRLARVVERILGDMEHDADVYRVPQPSRIWQVAREVLRGRVTIDQPRGFVLTKTLEKQPDGWDLNANTLLLNYLTLGLVQKAVHGQKAARDAGRYATPERTAMMVRWKDSWARDMREDRELYDGKRDGRDTWVEYMADAEREIDAIIARDTRAAA